MHKALFAAGFAAALVVSTQLAIADRHDAATMIATTRARTFKSGPVRSTSWTEWTTAH